MNWRRVTPKGTGEPRRTQEPDGQPRRTFRPTPILRYPAGYWDHCKAIPASLRAYEHHVAQELVPSRFLNVLIVCIWSTWTGGVVGSRNPCCLVTRPVSVVVTPQSKLVDPKRRNADSDGVLQGWKRVCPLMRI